MKVIHEPATISSERLDDHDTAQAETDHASAPESGEKSGLVFGVSFEASVEGIFIGILVDPDSSGFDCPEVTDDLRFQTRDESPNGVFQMGRRRLCRKSQDRDARIVCRSVLERIPKLEIEGDQTSLLLARGLDDPIVRCRAEAFVMNGCDVVAGRLQQLTGKAPEILVELEFQLRLRGTST
jgi:hypothetical protein